MNFMRSLWPLLPKTEEKRERKRANWEAREVERGQDCQVGLDVCLSVGWEGKN